MAVVGKELIWRNHFWVCFSWSDPTFGKIWVNLGLSSLSFIVPVSRASTWDPADGLVWIWDIDLDTKVLRKPRICWPRTRDGWKTKENGAQAGARAVHRVRTVYGSVSAGRQTDQEKKLFCFPTNQVNVTSSPCKICWGFGPVCMGHYSRAFRGDSKTRISFFPNLSTKPG